MFDAVAPSFAQPRRFTSTTLRALIDTTVIPEGKPVLEIPLFWFPLPDVCPLPNPFLQSAPPSYSRGVGLEVLARINVQTVVLNILCHI